MLPLESATLHAAGDEAPEPSGTVLRCPRCLTRNTEDQVYCWRCLHELRSTDVMDDAAPRPLTAALAKAANTPSDKVPEPEVSPFEPSVAAEDEPVDDADAAEEAADEEDAPPIAAAVEDGPFVSLINSYPLFLIHLYLSSS